MLETHSATLQIRPPLGSADIGRTARRLDVLRAAVDIGREAALSALAGCVEDAQSTRLDQGAERRADR